MKKQLTIQENIVILGYLGETAGVSIESLIDNVQAFPYQRGYTPTELGQHVEPRLSAIKVNKLLEEIGLQQKCKDKWIPTENGVPYALQGGVCIIKNSKGTFLKTNLLWKEEIITILRKKLETDNQGEKTAC